jgi:hypothetical protein
LRFEKWTEKKLFKFISVGVCVAFH